MQAWLVESRLARGVAQQRGSVAMGPMSAKGYFESTHETHRDSRTAGCLRHPQALCEQPGHAARYLLAPSTFAEGRHRALGSPQTPRVGEACLQQRSCIRWGHTSYHSWCGRKERCRVGPALSCYSKGMHLNLRSSSIGQVFR